MRAHPESPATERTDLGGGGESRLVQALRQGDEAAFSLLVNRYDAMLKRVARAYVGGDAVAEEVVQETWLGVIHGISRFEARASLKTWLVRIVVNRAKTRALRERRTVPFSALHSGPEDAGPSVDAERFQVAGERWPDHWSAPPRPWESPERRLMSLEVRERLRKAIGRLPSNQRLVVTLRDVDGLSADEVCELLELSEANQRVILHRGRSRLRGVLEAYLDG